MKIFRILLLLVCMSFVVSSFAVTKKHEVVVIKKIDDFIIGENVITSGFCKSNLISDLSFQTDGRIVFLPFSKGDFFKKGEVLARLDGVLSNIQQKEQKFRLNEAIIKRNKAKSYFARMDILHKKGAISDNDWEDAFYQLKTDEEQIKIQKEKLNFLQRENDFNMLIAPFDGYIVDKYSQIGSVVKIGMPILTIASANSTIVETMVNSSYINQIKVGQKVKIKFESKQYEAYIANISQTSHKEGGYIVKIAIYSLIPNLKDGMSVDVVFEFKNNSIYLPIKYFFEEDGYKYVYSVVDLENNYAKVIKQKVEVGKIIDDKVEIISGLNQNSLIVVSNFNQIKLNKKNRIKYE